MTYDLLLTGADVIDMGGSRVGRYDVAVRGGQVAAVGELAEADTRVRVDLAGRVLTPGLVDLHAHVFPAATYWGIDPDPVAWYSGVTTWVDAGSAGASGVVFDVGHGAGGFAFDVLEADLAVFRVEEGESVWADAHGQREAAVRGLLSAPQVGPGGLGEQFPRRGETGEAGEAS